MVVIKHTSKPISETIDVRKPLKKKVLAKDGRTVGTIKAIQMHPTTLTVEGIWIRKKFLDSADYISRDYIESLTEQGALLKIIPIKELIGLKVYDSRGKKVGTVDSVNRSKKTNNMISIVVNRGLLKKNITVARRAIKQIGKSIVLNIPIEE